MFECLHPVAICLCVAWIAMQLLLSTTSWLSILYLFTNQSPPHFTLLTVYNVQCTVYNTCCNVLLCSLTWVRRRIVVFILGLKDSQTRFSTSCFFFIIHSSHGLLNNEFKYFNFFCLFLRFSIACLFPLLFFLHSTWDPYDLWRG